MKATAFSGITKVEAQRLCTTLRANLRRLPFFTLYGTFQERRFVIARIMTPPTPPAADVVHDLENRSLTLNSAIDWSDLVRECARFGAIVAAADRKREPGFERVVDDKNLAHWCQKWHHVALCGSKGGWGDFEGGSSSAASCDACDRIASSTPTHRRRLPTLANVPSASA